MKLINFSFLDSFNQRLTAAAATTAIKSNSLVNNSGRSKLSTEEFKLEDDVSEHKSSLRERERDRDRERELERERDRDRDRDRGYNNSYNSNNSHSSYNSSNNSSNIPHNSSHLNNIPNNSYHSSNSNSSYNRTNNGAISYPSSSIGTNYNNNSFDRWNSSFSSNNGESMELLQEQLSHLRREHEGLKQRFSDLSRLRLSEPEEYLEEHKKLSESRDLAAERTIRALQKENEELKRQNKELVKMREEEIEDGDKVEITNVEGNTNKLTPSQSQQSGESENFLFEIEKILKIYSNFSGLKITPSPSAPLSQWHCEFSNRFGRFDFQLIFESNLNRYQYLPLQDDENEDENGKLKLPDFLSSDILMTSDQMQMFFWRLLDTLSKKRE